MRFTDWLTASRDLQENVFGLDYQELESSPEALADYLGMMHLALLDEVTEMLRETGWKPWSKTRGWVNREELKAEAVDVLHFLAHILNAIGIGGVELAEAYTAKLEENRRRQETGYEQRR